MLLVAGSGIIAELPAAQEAARGNAVGRHGLQALACHRGGLGPEIEIINSYINMLVPIAGRDARNKVSTRHYSAFGILVLAEVSYEIKSEPFIQGQAVPYDPKYHNEWFHNYNISEQLCRPSRTNDTPRNYYTWDVPNQVFQRRDMPTMNNNSYVQNAPPMPNRNIGCVQPSSPACVYPNQMPAPLGIYAPTRPGYQGNGHNYQAVNPNGPGYQGNGQGYQGGPPAYQQGGGPNYQQQTAYQSGPNDPPRRPSYQEGGRGAGGHDYQSAVPNYQQGRQGVAISSYQPPSSGYQYGQGVGPINVPGRD